MRKIILVLCLVGIASWVWAEVPKTINYQGRLTDISGNPVTDASYSVVVRLYDSSTAVEGASIWSDLFSVTTKNGYFNIVLGSGTAFSVAVDFNKPYWVGVKVGSDSEMTPRQPLNSVPYALNVPNKSIATEKLADNAATKTWYTSGANLTFSAASQTLVAAALTVTPAQDGVLFVWGKGYFESGANVNFYLVPGLYINAVKADGVMMKSFNTDTEIPYALQCAQPVFAGITYTVELIESTGGANYIGSSAWHKLMATVFYK